MTDKGLEVQKHFETNRTDQRWSRLCYEQDGPETMGAGCATNRTDQRPGAWKLVVLRTGRTRDQKLGSWLCYEQDGPETRSLGAGCATNRTDQRPEAREPVVLYEQDGPETRSLGAGCAIRTGRTRDQKLGSRLFTPNRTDQGLNVHEHFATNEGNQRP
jgi:hypothetical protein